MATIIGGLMLLFAWCVISAGLYFLPTIIAFARNKTNKFAILILNLFAGWSLIGWVIALIWAVTRDQPAMMLVNPVRYSQPPLQTDESPPGTVTYIPPPPPPPAPRDEP